VPAGQRLGHYQEGTPPLARDEPRQQRDQGTVWPTEARTADLAAEHPQLVPQDDDLGVLLENVHAEDAGQSEEETGEAVEGREGHAGQAWPIASSLVKATRELLGPSRLTIHPSANCEALTRSRDKSNSCERDFAAATNAAVSLPMPLTPSNSASSNTLRTHQYGAFSFS
jgi:hypothetical protein